MPATAATLLRRSAKPYLSVRQPVNSAGFPSFPALFLQPPAARDVLRPAASFRRAKVSAMHIDAHQPDRPTIKNEVCKFPCPKQRTCRLFIDNKLPPFVFTAESCAARFRTGRNPSAGPSGCPLRGAPAANVPSAPAVQRHRCPPCIRPRPFRCSRNTCRAQP